MHRRQGKSRRAKSAQPVGQGKATQEILGSAIARLPSRWASVTSTAPLPQAMRNPPSTSPGRPCPSASREASSFTRSPATCAPCAGMREAADQPIDLDRGAGPIDARLGLVDLAGIGHARIGLRLRRKVRPDGQASEGSAAHPWWTGGHAMLPSFPQPRSGSPRAAAPGQYRAPPPSA